MCIRPLSQEILKQSLRMKKCDVNFLRHNNNNNNNNNNNRDN